MGNEPSTLGNTGYKRASTSQSMEEVEEEGSDRSDEEVAHRQLATTVSPRQRKGRRSPIVAACTTR
jgi:hypothetical protein